MDIPAEILNAFGVRARAVVEIGAVFELRPPHVYYFSSTYARPGVVVRVALGADGQAHWAWLFYATTKHVPASMALELSAGEGGVHEDCRIDLRKPKEIDVASLLRDCSKIGRLQERRRSELETMLPASPLSVRVRSLPL